MKIINVIESLEEKVHDLYWVDQNKFLSAEYLFAELDNQNSVPVTEICFISNLELDEYIYNRAKEEYNITEDDEIDYDLQTRFIRELCWSKVEQIAPECDTIYVYTYQGEGLAILISIFDLNKEEKK
jgi:hypothetical protein